MYCEEAAYAASHYCPSSSELTLGRSSVGHAPSGGAKCSNKHYDMMADHPLMHTHPKSIISLAYNEKDIFSLFVVSGHTLNQIRAH